MDPANFQNMAGRVQAGGMQGNQAQGMQQKDQNFLVQQHVLSQLRTQGPFQGWQATVQINERANKIYQM